MGVGQDQAIDTRALERLEAVKRAVREDPRVDQERFYAEVTLRLLAGILVELENTRSF
jgi:hypothetical protein